MFLKEESSLSTNIAKNGLHPEGDIMYAIFVWLARNHIDCLSLNKTIAHPDKLSSQYTLSMLIARTKSGNPAGVAIVTQ